MIVPRYIKTLFIFYVLIFTIGCSHNLYVKAEHPQITPPEIKRVPLPGTIWAGENSANSLFSDRRAQRVNDIVTIVVSESSVGGNNATTDTSRDTTTAAGVTSLLGYEGAILDILRKGTTSINVGGTSANSLKGAGKTSRDGNLTATISARIVKILGNGNFIIEGRRQVTVNAEDQYIILTGIIRPDDIATDNTIFSQYIADARIVYTGKGVVDDKMRPGWLTRVVDWVWPF
ncbi:MAG TPA: flagellar basal body L-ring protein FlgH [Syntrophales bacterium]|nr:flagellar basal body L-ring protein FlgH [Syntrophales bacterium]